MAGGVYTARDPERGRHAKLDADTLHFIEGNFVARAFAKLIPRGAWGRISTFRDYACTGQPRAGDAAAQFEQSATMVGF